MFRKSSSKRGLFKNSSSKSAAPAIAPAPLVGQSETIMRPIREGEMTFGHMGLDQWGRGFDTGFDPNTPPPATGSPAFADFDKYIQERDRATNESPEGVAYNQALKQLEAFRAANPNPSSYMGYSANPALKAQYDQIYKNYQDVTSPYFSRQQQYETDNPFTGDIPSFSIGLPDTRGLHVQHHDSFTTTPPTANPDPVTGAPVDATTGTIDASQSTLSPNFADYVYRMLAAGEQAASLPFQEYTGQRFAGIQPLLQRAFQQYQNQQAPSQFEEATGIARLAAQRAGQLDYTPGQFAAERVGTRDISAAQTGYRPDLRTFQMQSPQERVTSESFTAPGTAAGYMSPYLQEALAPQLREAVRQADIARGSRGARFAQAGAFGGSRQAVEEAEAERNLQQRLADITGTGYQQAFGSAQEQFNREQQARQAAQQANVSTGLTVGQQNLAAQLGVQQLGTQTGLQAALANLTNEQQARVQSEANRLQASEMNQRQALEAQRLREQSRQYGAGLGLQGTGQQISAGQLMGGIGQQAGQYGLNALIGMLGAGTQQQQLAQQPFDFGYQQFQQSMQYPYQQGTYMSSLLSGLPLQAARYTPESSGLSGAIQGGLAGIGLYNAMTQGK